MGFGWLLRQRVSATIVQWSGSRCFGLFTGRTANNRQTPAALQMDEGWVGARFEYHRPLFHQRAAASQETDYAEKWRADLSDETVQTLLSQGVKPHHH